jgi:hypothetical protein
MINELAIQLDNFPESVSRVQCFAHILNLVVKSIMCQFDIPEKKKGEVADEATLELQKLAGDIERKESSFPCVVWQEDGEEASRDNMKGWVDERDEMDTDELQALDNAIQPIRFLLTKVSHL